MKTHIDFFETHKSEFLSGQRFKNRFVRWWGTETIDGVEVLKSRFYIYPNTHTNKTIYKMCQLLGMWDQIKDERFQGVVNYYLKINPDKISTANKDLITANMVAEKVDSAYEQYNPNTPEDPKWYEANLNFIDSDNVTAGMTDVEIIDYVKANYDALLEGKLSYAVNMSVEDGDAFAHFVFYDGGLDFELEYLSVEVSVVSITKYIDAYRSTRVYVPSISVNYRFRRISADTDTNGAMVTKILAVKEAIALQDVLTNNSYAEYGSWLSRLVSASKTDEIFYKGQLRKSVFYGSGLRTKESLEILLKALDTGYTKKKVKWYKKALGFVLLVIAIILAVLFPPAGFSMLAAISLYVGIAVVIMVGIQMYWAKTGDIAAAEYMGRWVKIGSIISLVTGIAGIIQTMTTQAVATNALVTATGMTAAEAAKIVLTASASEVAALAAMQATSTVSMEAVKAVAIETLKNSFKSVAMSVLKEAVKMRQTAMESKLQAKESQATQLEEEYEAMMDKGNQLALEDLKTYTEVLSNIKSRYDYDALYERDATTIHVGNILRSSSWSGGLNLRAEDLLYG